MPEVVEQITEITKVVLVPCAATAVKGFNYNAELFVAYVRSFLVTTKKGPVLIKGKTLTLSVFGEMQKFTVDQVTLGEESKACPNA